MTKNKTQEGKPPHPQEYTEKKIETRQSSTHNVKATYSKESVMMVYREDQMGIHEITLLKTE